MTNTTTEAPKAFLPTDFGELLVTTAAETSVALETTNVVRTDSHEFRIPLLTDDVSAAWLDELAEIPLDEAELSEEVVRPRAVKALTKVSNELADDSNPDASRVIGDSIARSVSRSIDAALFSANNGNGIPPKGLGAFTDAQVTTITAGAAWANVDPFSDAIYALGTVGAELNVFVANPADAAILAKLKKSADSNEPLLASDATTAGRKRLGGVELHISPDVPAGTIYGYDSNRIYTVIRKDVTVTRDDSVYFTSDAVGFRGVLRVAFGYPHPKAIARIKLSA